MFWRFGKIVLVLIFLEPPSPVGPGASQKPLAGSGSPSFHHTSASLVFSVLTGVASRSILWWLLLGFPFLLLPRGWREPDGGAWGTKLRCGLVRQVSVLTVPLFFCHIV